MASLNVQSLTKLDLARPPVAVGFLEKLETIATANTELENFHRQRAATLS
jgi:hypothetical protein